jgi:hypothetical protein
MILMARLLTLIDGHMTSQVEHMALAADVCWTHDVRHGGYIRRYRTRDSTSFVYISLAFRAVSWRYMQPQFNTLCSSVLEERSLDIQAI